MPRRVRAVALVVTLVTVDKILVLRERRSKPGVGKLEGMSSIPMETLLPEETDSAALKRLVEEELPGLPLPQLPGTYIGAYRIVRRVWVRLYATITDSCRLPIASGNSFEVGNHQWISVEEARGLWLRQGAREMIEDYAAGRNSVLRKACSPPKNPVWG